MQTDQGQRAIMAGNNIGTWTHLLVVSLSLFTGNFATVAAQLNSATLRLVAQCDVIGTTVCGTFPDAPAALFTF